MTTNRTYTVLAVDRAGQRCHWSRVTAPEMHRLLHWLLSEPQTIGAWLKLEITRNPEEPAA